MSAPNLSEVLARLKAAEFPRAYKDFYKDVAMLRKSQIGQRIDASWREHMGGCECPQVTFLALVQAELLRPSDVLLNEFKAGLRNPKRDLLRREAVPLKAAKLRAEIEVEDSQACQWVISELDGTADRERLFAALMNYGVDSPTKKPKPLSREQRERRLHRLQQEQDEKPLKPEIRSWSAPMSVYDYRDATGKQRKTVEKFLRRITARESNQKRKVGERKIYPVEVNLEVLAQWIGHWERNSERARRLAAATLGCTAALDWAFIEPTITTLFPVLERRKLWTQELVNDAEAHYDYYAPKPDPLSALLNYPAP